MPRVPTSGGPAVQEAALPDIRDRRQISADVLGGGESAQRLGQAAVQTVGVANDFFEEQKKIADDTAVVEADTLLGEAQLKTMKKVEQLKGKDAAGANELAESEWEADAAKIREGLSNDDQRAAFDQAEAQRRLQLRKNVMGHSSREMQSYHNETYQSGRNLAVNEGIANWRDPEAVKDSINKQKVLINDFAVKNGKSQEYIEEQTLVGTSKTHSGVINQMLDHDQFRSAKKYFRENKKEISAQDQDTLNDALEAGTLTGEAQEATDKIIAMGLSRQESLAEARKIEDPKKRDETVRRVNARFDEFKITKTELEQKRYQGVMDEIETTKARPPQSTWLKLTPAQRNAADARIKQLKTLSKADPGSDTYYSNLNLATNKATRMKWARETDVFLLRPKVSDDEFKELNELKNDILNSKFEAADAIETKNSIITNTLLNMGIDSGKSASKKDIRRGNLFRSRVEREVVALQEEKGRKITNQELRQIVNDLSVEVTVEGRFFDEDKRVFELQNGDVLVVEDIDDVPEEDQNGIKEAYRIKFRREPTEQEIVDEFKSFLKRQTPKQTAVPPTPAGPVIVTGGSD